MKYFIMNILLNISLFIVSCAAELPLKRILYLLSMTVAATGVVPTGSLRKLQTSL